MRGFKKALKTLFVNPKYRLVSFVILFAIVGVAVLLLSHAGAPYLSIEAENGNIGGNASVCSGPAASQLKCIKFGSAPSSNAATIVAAGDLVWSGSLDASSATATLVKQINPVAVLTLGDHAYTYNQDFQFDSSVPYPTSTSPCHSYISQYYNHWGIYQGYNIRAITYPAVGNHEYMYADFGGTAHCGHSGKTTVDPAKPYYDYFNHNNVGGPGGIPTASDTSRKGYYSYDIPGTGWHMIALNSECTKVPGGCNKGVTGNQYDWLSQDLASTHQKCVLAYFHRPIWQEGKTWDSLPPGFSASAAIPSSAPDAALAKDDLTDDMSDYTYDAKTKLMIQSSLTPALAAQSATPFASTNSMDDIVKLLRTHNADVILQAHTHVYEHMVPMSLDSSGSPVVDSGGITMFMVGTGGAPMSWFTPSNYVNASSPGSWSSRVVAHSKLTTDHGILEMTLHANSMDYQFVPTNPSTITFSDHGNLTCHAKS